MRATSTRARALPFLALAPPRAAIRLRQRRGVEVDTLSTGFGRCTGAGFHSAFDGGVMGMVRRIVSLGGEAST
jgi:hypothetical protein